MYNIIPIFKDPYLHPLHKNNGLSALWVQPDAPTEPFFIIEHHPDSDKFMEDYKWLDDEWIVTPDKKILNHFYEFKDVYDFLQLHSDDSIFVWLSEPWIGKDKQETILRIFAGLGLIDKIKQYYICKGNFNKKTIKKFTTIKDIFYNEKNHFISSS